MRLILFSLLTLITAHLAHATSFQRWTTPEGTRIILAERHNLPIVDINIAFEGAGNAAAPIEQPSLAAFTASLLTAGTQKLSEDELLDQVNDLAAELNSGSTMEYANIRLRSLSNPKSLQAAVQLVNQSLTQPRFDTAVLTRNQQEAATALAQNETNPDFLAARAAGRLNYPHHPYNRTTLINRNNIFAINRNNIVHFYQQHYAQNNAIIAVVGDLTRKQTEQLVHQIMKGLPHHAKASVAIPPVAATPSEKQHITFHGEQAKIVLTMPFIRRDDPDYYPLIVGNYILGSGGFDSRLMHTLRDRYGYTYGAYSSLTPYQQNGPLTIAFSTQQTNTQAALAATHQVIQDFVQKGPTETELAQAKANLIGGFPLRIDTNAKLLDYLTLIAIYNLPDDFLSHYPKRIEAVSAEDVRRVWQTRLQPEKLNQIVVGKP